MTQQPTDTRGYLFGNSEQEQERLKLQARIIGGWTRRYLHAAGLEPGMHVLDVGTGMGDVALAAEEIVGPSGEVVGIDRDAVTLEKARARASGLAGVKFVHSDLLSFTGGEQFDAVVGRYVLLYQPDPVAALRHLASLVRSGGILCFHEVALGTPTKSYPEDTLFYRVFVMLGEVFRRMGVNADFGLQAAKSFLDAGLPRPMILCDVPVGGEPGAYLYGWVAETVKSLLPRIEALGLGTAEELDVSTLRDRLEEEALRTGAELIGPLQFGCFIRKP